MFVGLVATATSFAGITAAQHGAAIVVAMVLFQVAVNALLAQVPALIAQEVPAEQKNTAAALLTLGAPLAAAASALVVVLARDEATRLLLVAGLMALCVAPLLLAHPPEAASSDVRGRDRIAGDDPVARSISTRRALAVAWTTRLLVQIANSGVGLCLFFYFARLIGPDGDTPAIVAQSLLVATLVPVPLALLLGRWCDRTGGRERVLSGTAILAGVGLLGMAFCDDWRVAALCYVVFGTAVAIFQALNTGHAMLLLPPGMGQGRSLGLLNLANTLPQVIAPLLALLASNGDLSTIFAMFALLSFVAAILPRASDLLFTPRRMATSCCERPVHRAGRGNAHPHRTRPGAG